MRATWRQRAAGARSRRGKQLKNPTASGTPAPHHPTLQVYIDESGIANPTRFVTIGGLIFRHDHGLFNNQLQVLRNQLDLRSELHFVNVNRVNAYQYREVVKVLAGTDARFVCGVADKEVWDPFSPARPAWKTHAQMTIDLLQAIAGTGHPTMSVVVDHITTPTDVNYEGYIATAVNRNLGYLAVAGINRMDSRACSGLQVADILTGAVAHQHRQSYDPTAKAGSPKGQVAAYTSQTFNLRTLVGAKSRRFKTFEMQASGRKRRSNVRSLRDVAQRDAG